MKKVLGSFVFLIACISSLTYAQDTGNKQYIAIGVRSPIFSQERYSLENPDQLSEGQDAESSTAGVEFFAQCFFFPNIAVEESTDLLAGTTENLKFSGIALVPDDPSWMKSPSLVNVFNATTKIYLDKVFLPDFLLFEPYFGVGIGFWRFSGSFGYQAPYTIMVKGLPVASSYSVTYDTKADSVSPIAQLGADIRIDKDFWLNLDCKIFEVRTVVNLDKGRFTYADGGLPMDFDYGSDNKSVITHLGRISVGLVWAVPGI